MQRLFQDDCAGGPKWFRQGLSGGLFGRHPYGNRFGPPQSETEMVGHTNSCQYHQSAGYPAADISVRMLFRPVHHLVSPLHDRLLSDSLFRFRYDAGETKRFRVRRSNQVDEYGLGPGQCGGTVRAKR